MSNPITLEEVEETLDLAKSAGPHCEVSARPRAVVHRDTFQ